MNSEGVEVGGVVEVVEGHILTDIKVPSPN